MHARVTSLGGSPDEVDADIADFREKVVPFTHEQGGKGVRVPETRLAVDHAAVLYS